MAQQQQQFRFFNIENTDAETVIKEVLKAIAKNESLEFREDKISFELKDKDGKRIVYYSLGNLYIINE